ncbi:MAG: phosphatase family protein [Chitinophagaceae bacterium]|nr:phosphatase family protein [Chitinophagaceae bacterium]
MRCRSYFLILLSAIGIATPPTIVNAQTVITDSVRSIENTDPQPPIAGESGKKKDTTHLYRVNYWVSSTICVVATATDIYAIPYVIKNKITINDQEFRGLNRNVYSSFDQIAFNQDPAKRHDYALASDYTLPGLIVLPAFLAMDKNIKKDWFRILVMYYEMHSITFSIYNYSPFGPEFQNKFRPLVYYEQLSIDEKKGGNNRNSMYSGHTATAIASTYFMVKVYCDYHPEIGNKKYLLYGLATLPPLAEGYFRVKAMLHFPSDVMIGVVIGAACGILVPEVHRFKNHKLSVGMTPTPYGQGVKLNWDID